MPDRRPWQEAWQDALYGPAGFYRRPEGPAGHFRTAAHASSTGLLGAALARLARAAGCAAVLDVGAGRGELLRAVRAADADLRLTGVDLVDRPPGLPDDVVWATAPTPPDRPTLIVAWELLDVVPVPVLELDDDGRLRVVEVARDGSEGLGGPASPDDAHWAGRWWPATRPGDRVEVGRPREEVWARLVGLLAGTGGLALAVDYGHDAADRPPHGTVAGYAAGRRVPAVPDGGCDITAHVALDALAAVRPGSTRVRQREALRALGVDPGRPSSDLAGSDPVAYLTALSRAGEAAELLDPEGLGGFGWVLHPEGSAARRAVRDLVGP